MSELFKKERTPDWKAVILFGQNVASYKFALAKSRIELSAQDNESVKLDELAEPFSAHIIAHLAGARKQITWTHKLIDQTTKLGLIHLIDATSSTGAKSRFAFSWVSARGDGIRLRDELVRLRDRVQFRNLAGKRQNRKP